MTESKLTNLELSIYLILFFVFCLSFEIFRIRKDINVLKELEIDLLRYLKNIDNNIGNVGDNKSLRRKKEIASDENREREEKRKQEIANDPWLK